MRPHQWIKKCPAFKGRAISNRNYNLLKIRSAFTAGFVVSVCVLTTTVRFVSVCVILNSWLVVPLLNVSLSAFTFHFASVPTGTNGSMAVTAVGQSAVVRVLLGLKISFKSRIHGATVWINANAGIVVPGVSGVTAVNCHLPTIGFVSSTGSGSLSSSLQAVTMNAVNKNVRSVSLLNAE